MPPNEIKTKVNELAKAVEEKLGVSGQEVLDQWEEDLTLVASLREDMSKEDQEKRAFLRLRGTWKRELRSPALFYEGMLIRVATPFDVLRSMHASAALIYEKNPQKAVAEGWTDEEGHALDNRQKFSTGRVNEDFGKQLPEHRYIQNITGIAKSQDMDVPLKFNMVLSERLAGQIQLPVFQPIKFRANPAKKQPTDGTMALNEYANLRFRPSEIEGFPGPEDIIHQFFSDNLVPIEDLADWHKTNANDPRRMAIVEGDVDDVDTRANPSTGNSRIVMIDESGDVEVTVWVPEHLRSAIDFGPSSRVITVGRTAQNTFNNEERTMLNGEGIYAIPKWKMPLEETPESVVSNAEDVN